MKQPTLTRIQFKRALIWEEKYRKHVSKIRKETNLDYPPTDSEDKNNPALWKPEHWNWFFIIRSYYEDHLDH